VNKKTKRQGFSTVHKRAQEESEIPVPASCSINFKRNMEEAGQEYLKLVPVGVEVSVADSWAEK